MSVVGVLGSGSAAAFANRMRVFRQSLSEVGFIEGRNVAIESRWDEGHYDRVEALAADLVHRQVAVIFAVTGTAAQAAKAATATIPIVFTTAADPIASGLVTNLSRPEGNVTGATSLGAELGPKRLELLHEAVPTATTFAVLVNPTTPLVIGLLTENLAAAARSLGLELRFLPVSTEDDLDAAFADLARRRVGGVLTTVDPFLNSQSRRLAALSLRHALPMMFYARDFVASGGLMSYGGSSTDSFRIGGGYAGRILKGEKPADLPVQQSAIVELALNLKTAKALGLTFPLPLLGRADEVIE
jgi:putative tryptophan/tyrosine transport system substrate-binding protein